MLYRFLFLSFLAGLFQTLPSLWHSHGESSAETTSSFRGLAGSALPSYVCVLLLLPSCKEALGSPIKSTGEEEEEEGFQPTPARRRRAGPQTLGPLDDCRDQRTKYLCFPSMKEAPTLTLSALLSQPPSSPEAWILQTTCVMN